MVRLSILRSAAVALALLPFWSCGGSEFTAQNTQNLPDASSGGAQGRAGSAGAVGRGGAGAVGGTGGTGGDGGDGGSAGEPGDAAGGSTSADAGDGAAGEDGSGATGGVIGIDAMADGSCPRKTFYPDGDGDGFGTEDGAIVACEAPAQTWVLSAGDCNDAIQEVNPDADDFVGTGYDAKNGLAFDYDCDGREEADTSQYGAKPNCGTFNLGNCRGAGFSPTGRTGQGVDPTCGSTTFVECKPDLVLCAEAVSVVPPKRCR
jgi:hypothetical protein